MEEGKFGCVVVAVDGSEESMQALRWALDNLRLRPPASHSQQQEQQPEDGTGGHFLVLHVQSPPNIAAGLNPGAIPFGGPDVEVPAFCAAIEAHQRRISDAIIAHALEICSEKKVHQVKTQVVMGDPKDMICEVTSNLQADLLIMGSHAYGPIKRMFLGSVSNCCINNVKCPIIVVKGTS